MPVLCPTCNVALAAITTPFGLGWLCPRCHGRAANLNVMRRALREPFMREVWHQAIHLPCPTLRAAATHCPSCRNPMRTIRVEGDERAPVVLDICPSCQMAWMAADQIPALPRQPGTRLAPDQQKRELPVTTGVDTQADRAPSKRMSSAPEGWVRPMLALVGFPAEENTPPLVRRPWATWALAAGMIAITLWILTSNDPSAGKRQWGLLPNDPFRHGGSDWITRFFVHANIRHLMGNVIFLLIFGDNVEDLLGRVRYLMLVLIAGVVAAVAHVLLDTHPSLPLVGASGAISGILVFYALAFPRAKLVFFLWGLGWLWSVIFGVGGNWLRLSARWALAAWVLLQIVGVSNQVSGASNISALAHLGGALAGGLAWWCWRGSLNPVPESVSARP